MAPRGTVLALALLLAGCSRDEPAPAAAPPPPAAAEPDARAVIAAFGDSLTAGHGLAPGQTYPDFLQKELDRMALPFRVVNQGVSGDTTGDALDRLDAVLRLHPIAVILEFGGNDGLRGLPVEATRRNLAQMIDAFQRAGARVLLCGMTLPRNYGSDYIRSFEAVYRGLAREKKVALIPFLLEGVATDPGLMQSDGIHPTAAGAAIVAHTVMTHLAPLLR